MSRRLLTPSLTLLLILASPVVLKVWASKRAHFDEKIPNGGVFKCSTCHEGQNKDGQWNAFGGAVDLEVSGAGTSRTSNWLALSNLDSDGDGWANGEERLDPECVWVVGGPDPGESALATRPGDPGDFPDQDVVPLPDVRVSEDAGSQTTTPEVGPMNPDSGSDPQSDSIGGNPDSAHHVDASENRIVPTLVPIQDDDGRAGASIAPMGSLFILFYFAVHRRRR